MLPRHIINFKRIREILKTEKEIPVVFEPIRGELVIAKQNSEPVNQESSQSFEMINSITDKRITYTMDVNNFFIDNLLGDFKRPEEYIVYDFNMLAYYAKLGTTWELASYFTGITGTSVYDITDTYNHHNQEQIGVGFFSGDDICLSGNPIGYAHIDNKAESGIRFKTKRIIAYDEAYVKTNGSEKDYRAKTLEIIIEFVVENGYMYPNIYICFVTISNNMITHCEKVLYELNSIFETITNHYNGYNVHENGV